MNVFLAAFFRIPIFIISRSGPGRHRLGSASRVSGIVLHRHHERPVQRRLNVAVLQRSSTFLIIEAQIVRFILGIISIRCSLPFPVILSKYDIISNKSFRFSNIVMLRGPSKVSCSFQLCRGRSPPFFWRVSSHSSCKA